MMKHARQDYDRIQDPAGLIPEDEPVFLIRGSDENAAGTIDYWADRAELSGSADNIVFAARQQAILIRRYQKRNGSKIPDMPDNH